MKKKLNLERSILIILISGFSFLSCQKEDFTVPDEYESVFLRSLTGLNGCQFVLQKTNNEYLEPSNLEEFNVQLEVGKEYWIKCENPYPGGYCKVGYVVQLLDIRPPYKHY